jgi:hypothetical protein
LPQKPVSHTKTFFWIAPQHQQNQTCGGKLRQHPEYHAKSSGKLSRAKKDREALAHANALAAAFRIF